MKFVDRRYMVVDAEQFRVIAVGRQVLRGKCLRCGECCRRLGCKSLKTEILDGVAVAVCGDYFNRPIWCALWPLPESKRPEGCGFHYEDVTE